jgi:hypothetical protein
MTVMPLFAVILTRGPAYRHGTPMEGRKAPQP